MSARRRFAQRAEWFMRPDSLLVFEPSNGDVYVFLNKSRTTIKLRQWKRGGFVTYYKRMESGYVIK